MKKLMFCILLIVLFSSPVLAAAPTITKYLNRCIALEGTTAEFSISATGTEPLTYQWQRSNNNSITWFDIRGANMPDYSFTAYTSDDGARLRVIVSNIYGSITSNTVTLTVIIANTPPRIIVDLALWYPAIEGTMSEFSIMAVTGTAPLTYQWQRTDDRGNTWININGANAANYSLIVRASDEKSFFRVIISNSYGSVTSNITYLIVQLIQPGFRIDTQPAENTTVTEGSITGNLFVEASVSPFGRLYYQWFYNTINNNTDGIAIVGATRASFAIPTTLTASGSPYYFYCVVIAQRDPTIDPAISTQFLSLASLPPAPQASDVATVTVKIDPDNNITIGGEQIALGENISGFDWEWNAANRILTLFGENMDSINITTSSDVRIVVKDNTTLPRIVKTGTGSLTILVESGKTLTIDSTFGPAINASGDIVLTGTGTIHASTKDENTSAITSNNGSLSITARNLKVTAYGNGYALYAQNIAITSGTTELNAKNDDHAFNVEPEYRGINTKVIAPSGKVFFKGNGDSIGGGGGCNSIIAYGGVFGILIVLLTLWTYGLWNGRRKMYN